MKKSTINIAFLLVVFMFFIMPTVVKAKDAKRCVYSGDNHLVEIYIKNDYSARLVVVKYNGKKTESSSAFQSLKEWNKIEDSIKNSTNMPCPKYLVLEREVEYFTGYAYNAKSDADKKYNKVKKKKFPVSILNLKEETFINNSSSDVDINDRKEVDFSCTYYLNANKIPKLPDLDGKKITISLSADGYTVLKPDFDILHGSLLWHYDSVYHDFDKEFREAASKGECPTLGVLVRADMTNIDFFTHALGSNEGWCDISTGSICENFSAQGGGQITEEGESGGIKKPTYQTCSFSERVYYYNNRSKWFYPRFRRSSNGTIEWTLNEDRLTDDSKIAWTTIKKDNLLNSSIQLADGSGYVRLESDMYESIFETSNDSLNCPGTFTRNVDHMGGNGTQNTNLVLSFKILDQYRTWTESDDYLSYSSEREYRQNNASLDGLNQSISCSQLFSTEEEGSVAWLIQQLLNYIRIFGPILVVILSAMDFIKAVASSDEEAMKKAQGRLVIRLIAAIALFLVPTLVELVLKLITGVSDPTCFLK